MDRIAVTGIMVRSYDGFKKKVIETSYPNLDQGHLSFEFPGPLIRVNGDQKIVVPRGTESPDIFFSVNYPVRINLRFVPTFTGNMTIVPQVVLFKIMSTSTKFRLQVPQNLKVGSYEIVWTTFGELDVPFYTAIHMTTVEVIDRIGIIYSIII